MHWYGKEGVKKNRKIGHITFVGTSAVELLNRVKIVQGLVPAVPVCSLSRELCLGVWMCREVCVSVYGCACVMSCACVCVCDAPEPRQDHPARAVWTCVRSVPY